jgi:hypothetical protein
VVREFDPRSVSRIHTLSDDELLKLFREVAQSKAPDVKDAPPLEAGYLSGLTKQVKTAKESNPDISLQGIGKLTRLHQRLP